MRQLHFRGQGKVEWREVKDARVEGALQAVVRPLVIGRCDLDVGFVRGFVALGAGEPIGHEAIGIVTDIGGDVKSVIPGDLVVVPAQISCGWCRNCRRGFTGRCLSVPMGASYGMGREGAFGSSASDLVRIPFADGMLFKLPPTVVPLEWIGFADMALDAWRATGRPLQDRPGARTLVIGGWPSVIGIYCAGIASALGASEVAYWDADPVRMHEAVRYGANVIERGKAEPVGLFEIVVDCTTRADSFADAIRFVEPEGIITSVTYHRDDPVVPLLAAYRKGVTIKIGRPNVRPPMDELCPLCLRGVFHPHRLTTKFVAFDDAPDAWASDELRIAAVRD